MFIIDYDTHYVTENQCYWNKLSDKPMSAVFLRNQNIIVGLIDMDEYWFSNINVASVGNQGILVEQIIGGRKGDKMTEIVQDVRNGHSKIMHPSAPTITLDHKPGRKEDDGNSKGLFGHVQSLFRRHK